jgi:hypothetical protein
MNIFKTGLVELIIKAGYKITVFQAICVQQQKINN